ncbi:MAG: hypothetical protein M3452_07285 [Chloroflexota bacterium]|nr:hypothetical protein [Chloroflexota bacterium]
MLAPGLTTLPVRGWRAGVSTAFAVTLGQPSLWLLGALGFAGRGGFLLLALPIITIPSPVVLSTIFRGSFATTGLSSDLESLLLLLVGVLLVGGLLLAAYADVAAFERLARDPESDELRAGLAPRGLQPGDRRRLVLVLGGIQAVALVPALIVVSGLYEGMTALVTQELRAPSSLEVPLVLRILEGARDQLLVLALLILAADAVHALASRGVLAWRLQVGAADGPRASSVLWAAMRGAERLVARPLRTAANVALTWAITLLVLAPIVWASLVAWDGVRAVFLSPAGLTEPMDLALAILATAGLAAIWLAGAILAGSASALRAAVWSADALR